MGILVFIDPSLPDSYDVSGDNGDLVGDRKYNKVIHSFRCVYTKNKRRLTIMDFGNFIADRNTALFSLDEAKIVEYAKKYKLPTPVVDKAFWGGVYKACLSLVDCPADVADKAKKWLKENGMSENIF